MGALSLLASLTGQARIGYTLQQCINDMSDVSKLTHFAWRTRTPDPAAGTINSWSFYLDVYFAVELPTLRKARRKAPLPMSGNVNLPEG